MLQKLKKYALPLLLLQFLLTIGIGFYLQNQLDKSVQQKKDFGEALNHYLQSSSAFMEKETKVRLDVVKRRVEMEQVAQSFLECALQVEKVNREFVQQIEADMLSATENTEKEYFKIAKLAAKHREAILRAAEKMDGYSDLQERQFIAEIYDCYSISNPEKMATQWSQKKDLQRYRVYLEKVKNDLWHLEYELISYLSRYIDTRSRLLFAYYPRIETPQKEVIKGETLKLNISLSKRLMNRNDCVFVVAGDTLPIDSEKVAHYHFKTNRLGTHQVKGDLVCVNGYSFDFVHTYEVLPKCNP